MLQRRPLIGLGVASAAGGLAHADMNAYPRHQVRIVAPFGAGGSSDLIARLVGRQLQAATSKPFAVENLPGGNGTVGVLAVMNAPADGHTLLLGTTTTLSASPFLLKNPPFDPGRDFSVVCAFGQSAGCLMVLADSPHRTVEDLVAHIRANPGKLNSGWFNGSSRIPAALFKRVGRLDFEEVSYKGFSNAISDLRTGLIQFVFLDMVAADAQLRSGVFRALAVTTPRRVAALPNIPAMNELFEGFETGGFWGFAVRAGTPLSVQRDINRLATAAVQSPEVLGMLRDMVVEPMAMDLEQTAAYAERERAKWGGIIQRAGIEPE
jgi:tripartite-type tricarboxylate transporter receptor subunit TctC